MTELRPLSAVLDGVVGADPDRVALIVDGQPTTYGELDRAARSCARGLSAAGVKAGHRVPVADDAGALGVAAVIGAARIGAAAALMNPRLTPGELAAMVTAASATGPGVAGIEFAPSLERAGCQPVLGAADLIDTTVPGPDARHEPRPTDDAVVLFTSGTTGTPKAVPLDNELIGAKIDAYAPAVDPVAAVSLLSVPFVHVGGMLGSVVALARGSTVVVLARFDAGAWLSAVEAHRVTTSFVVPTMLHRILAHPAFDSTDLSSLTALTYGAAPASPELITAARAALPGVALVNTFGQTETAGSIATLPPGDHSPERLRSVGRPLPGVEVRIVDPTTLADVATGGVGELWVKRDPKVAARRVLPEPIVPAPGPGNEGGRIGGDGVPSSGGSSDSVGWLRTGDLVSGDEDGYLYPAGRLSDTINRGGEKIAPMEIEDVVRAHPAVRDVAAFGVDDEEMGHRVGVAAVAEGSVTIEDLQSFCGGRLASFKLPEHLLVIDEIPYNDFGKVDRKLLRSLMEPTQR